jgi:hypothetical protein
MLKNMSLDGHQGTYIFDNINNKNNTNHALLWKISNFGKAE